MIPRRTKAGRLGPHLTSNAELSGWFGCIEDAKEDMPDEATSAPTEHHL